MSEMLNEAKSIDGGILYTSQKEYELAIAEFQKVLRVNPHNNTARIKLGHVYLQQKNFSEAIIQFKMAMEINPQGADSHEGLGFCYFELGMIDEAVDEFNYVLKSNINSEHTHFGLGLCYLSKNEIDKAIEHFVRVSKINSLHTQVNYHLGLCYCKKNDYPQALTQFNKALGINPGYWHVHESLAFIYLEQDKPELSLNELQKIKGPYSQTETHHNLMAKIHLKQNKDDLAIEELKKILAINPHSEFASETLKRIYCQQQKYSLAKNLINTLLAMNPSKFYLYQELGAIYVEENNYTEAILQYKKALEGYSREKAVDNKNTILSIGQVYKDIGRTYLLMKEYSLAIPYLKKVMEIDPSDLSLYRFISKAYMEMQDYDSAVSVLSEKYNHFDAAGKIDSAKDDRIHKQEGKRIKILRIPNFYYPEILSSEMNSIMLPPLALANITSYARSHGILIDQDDLHIKVHYDNYFSKDPEKKINETVFFDDRRVIRYACGVDDPEIDALMERVCVKTDLSGYQLILFSLDSCSMNFSHAMFALSFSRFLKKKYNPIIILGGLRYFPELMQKMECTWPHIDYVICNEGEEVLVELFDSLFNAPILEAKVKSDTHQRVIYSVEVPKPIKPDFDGLPLERYAYQGVKEDLYGNEELQSLVREFNSSKTLLLPFKFIKGCTNRCIFCASSYGGLIHVVEPCTVAVWLEELQKKYEPTGYLFLDDTLNISKKYLLRLCHEITKRKLAIRWSDCVRVDRLDKDSIYRMRDAGCIRMVFGMETASRKLLRYIQKDIDLNQLEDLLYCAHKAGIWTGIEIISGLPHENDEDVKETISFLQHNKENIDALYYNAFNIKDTSLLQAHPERYGITNIFELSSYEDGFATFVKYGFDEINGLSWPEKRKQILSNLNKIIGIFGDVPFPEHEYEHFLFFLYTKFNDKKRIRDLFYAVGSEKMKHVKYLRSSRTLGQDAGSLEGKALSYGGR